jgi:hypothetical protein
MKLYKFYTTLLIIFLLSACGGGGGGKTLETSAPNACTNSSDCSGGQVCTNNTCQAQPDPSPDVDLSSNKTSYQNCAYYGLSDGSDGNCSDGTSLTSVRTDTTKWKNFQQIMQIAAAKALLSHDNKNVNGSGVTINIIGSGVKNVIGLNNVTNEVADIPFVYCSGDKVGGGNNPGTKCILSDSSKTSTVTQNKDQDDLANGTMLASIIANQNKGGVTSQATIKSTQIFAELDSSFTGNTSTDDDYSESNKILLVNAFHGKNIDGSDIKYNAVNDAVSGSAAREIILFNNQQKFKNEDRLSDNLIKVYSPGLLGYDCDVNTWCYNTLQNNEATNVNNISSAEGISDIFFDDDDKGQNIKTLLNKTDRIFITPVDNVLISAATYKTNVAGADLTSRDKYHNNSNTYSNLIAIADVNVLGVTYKTSVDENQIKEIDTVVIGSNFVSGDCSKFKKENCFIAPGGDNNFAIDKSGADINFSGTKESAASAYIAGGFALLENQFYSSATPTDIIAKVRDTATKADKITGCTESAGDCGSGIPNFYKAAKSVTANGASVTNAKSVISNISQSSLIVAPAFGNGLQAVNNHFAKTIYLDDYNFVYNADLDKKINISQNNLSLKNFFNFNNKQVNLLDKFNVTNNLSFDLLSKKQALSYNDLASDISSNFTGSKQNNFIEDSKLTNLKFKHNFANFSVDFAYKTNYQNNNLLLTPALKSANNYLNLSANKENKLVTINYQLNNKLSFANSWLASDETSLYVTKADFSANKNTKLSLSLGFLNEGNAILGMKSQGAFGNNSSNSNYVNLQFLHKVKTINFFASLAWGATQVQLAENSLFTKFSDFSSQEMQIVINKKFNKNIEVGFNYVEPLRVTSGQVAVTSQQIKNNKVAFISNDSSISPGGKERNYEIYFNKNINENSNLSLNLLRVTEAGHDKVAKDNNVILIKLKKEF